METTLTLFNSSGVDNARALAIVVNEFNNQQEDEYFYKIVSEITKNTLTSRFHVKTNYCDFAPIPETRADIYKKEETTVVFCTNVITKRPVALKIKGLRKNATRPKEMYNENKFEIYFCDKLCNRGHPNIIQTYNYWIVDAAMKVYIEMERCETSLNTYMKAKEFKIDLVVAINILRQVIDALYYCHEKNVIHGDVKAGNIMLTGPDMAVKLIDFEFSRETGMNGCTGYVKNINCIPYWPFELLMGAPYLTYALDMFAVGYMFISMIGGDQILENDKQKQLNFINKHSGPIPVRMLKDCSNPFGLTPPNPEDALSFEEVFPSVAAHGDVVVLFISRLLDIDQDTRMTAFSAKHDPIFFKYQ